MGKAKPAGLPRLSHACIVSAQADSTAMDTALHIAAAAVCERNDGEACGACRQCRKALSGIHPDIVTVSRPLDDKGRKKREIGVDQIRAVAADAYILPNEARCKVYIIDEAESMNVSAQNAALKLLEEPPKNVLFLLCSTNTACLLTTVRSRCAEIKCGGVDASADAETEKLAKAYLKAVSSRDPMKLYAWCAANESMDTRAAAEFLDCARELTADMLCSRKNAPGLSAEELFRLDALLARCCEYLRVNTGVKHIFGLLAVDSISGSGNRG